MDKNEKFEAVVGDHVVDVTAGDGSITLTLGLVVLDETCHHEERITVRVALVMDPEEAIVVATAIAEAAIASEGVIE